MCPVGSAWLVEANCIHTRCWSGALWGETKKRGAGPPPVLVRPSFICLRPAFVLVVVGTANKINDVPICCFPTLMRAQLVDTISYLPSSTPVQIWTVHRHRHSKYRRTVSKAFWTGHCPPCLSPCLTPKIGAPPENLEGAPIGEALFGGP